jgi:hypothetical protein
MSQQEIRTCLSKLKSTGELTNESTNKYRIITLCNFEEYQKVLTEEQQANQQTTQQTINRQATATKNVKKEKEVKKGGAEIPFDTPKFRNVWEEWMSYRKEHRWSTKDSYLKSSARDLKKLAGDDVSLAIKIIRQSMAKGWQGLFALKGGDYKTTKPRSGTKDHSRFDEEDTNVEEISIRK